MTNGTGSGSGTGSKVGHTAGPWRITSDGNRLNGDRTTHLFGSDDTAVCVVIQSGIAKHEETADANARLIAAAPELLDALEAIRARIKGDYDNPALVKQGPLTAVYADVLAFASAAIAKAEGRD